MIDVGKDLQMAFEDGYQHGKRDAQRWIPCSERLPEKAGRYLVTCEKWGAWEVDWNIWNEGVGWLWEQGVSAWMPLPEPYKGEQT